MPAIFEALGGAFRSLFSIRIVWLMIWPVLVSMFAWGVLSIVFWSHLQQGWIWVFNTIGLTEWMTGIEPAWMATILHIVLNMMLYVPLVMLTALILTAIFGMDTMVGIVSERFFPQLEKRHGGSMLGSTENAFTALLIWTGLWIITLPLWLLGPVGAIVPLVAAGYLNQRLFRYDALAIHANADELKMVVERNHGTLWVLGILLALLQYIPVLNFFAPVYTGLVFIHFCLGRLNQTRNTAV